MNGVHISFYLKTSRIYIFLETLRRIGSPRRIRFLLSLDGRTLVVQAHAHRDFTSHMVPRDAYGGKRPLEISSQKFCGILTELHGWDPTYSYRVPGRIAMDARSALFFLDKAEIIR